MTSCKLIFDGHPILGKLLTLSPWKIFALTSLAACLLLLFPAWLINLHSIPTLKGNQGFFYKYNWSIMFPLVIPLLLAMTSAISKRMHDCVTELTSCGRITAVPNRDVPCYKEALSGYLKKRASKLFSIILTITILITVLDTIDLWTGFITDRVPDSRNPEWDTAFNSQHWSSDFRNPDFINYQQNPPSKISNLLFDLVAYLFQGTAFFLGLFWVAKFALYLYAFARLIGGDDSSYRFNPLTNDLDSRMGLKPMGVLFNSFLAITLVLEGYAFYHRLILIDGARGQSSGTYLKTTFRNIIAPPKDNPIPSPFNHFSELLKTSSWGLDGLDSSALITIFFMTVPIVVVCFLPLWRIRELVNKRRNEEIIRLQKEYNEALETRNYDKVRLVQLEKQSLEKANIWPNGNDRATSYFTIIGALAMGAIAPPLLAIVLTARFSEGLIKYFKLIFNK